jgi:hypothetical protein
MLRSMLVECAAEQQEYRDEDGDPENANRNAKGVAEAEAHRTTLRSARRPVILIAAGDHREAARRLFSSVQRPSRRAIMVWARVKGARHALDPARHSGGGRDKPRIDHPGGHMVPAAREQKAPWSSLPLFRSVTSPGRQLRGWAASFLLWGVMGSGGTRLLFPQLIIA